LRIRDTHESAELRSLIETASRFEPSRYLSTTLWFDRPLGSERFWARVSAPGDLNTDFYDLSHIRALSNGRAWIASNAIHVDRAWEWSDDEIIARTRRELAEFCPPAADAIVRHARVHRIPLAVPCAAPGTEAMRPGPWSGSDGLWVAGDWIATGLPFSMESAARSGAMTAESVAAAHGRVLKVVEPLPETEGIPALFRRRTPRRYSR
jgi:15-cis-phytoene desaturase